MPQVSEKMKQVIGLTGGIASGKSTVSAYLKELGQTVIDADAVVHELQGKGGALYQVLVDWLGSEVLQPDGQLDRKKLSAFIFGSSEHLTKSAELQNPIIRQELKKRLDQALLETDLVFLDIPLLYEQGYESWCDHVWVVYVDKETQVERLMARNGYTQEEAELRISRQMSLEEKKMRADKVIDNGASLEVLQERVQELLKRIEKYSELNKG